MEYDLVRLFEHPMMFRLFIPSAIAVFGGTDVGRIAVSVESRESASAQAVGLDLGISWDVASLRPRFAEVDEEVFICRELDEDHAEKIERAAVVVAVAVLSCVDPTTRFARRSGIGSRHDYYLGDGRDEMIEIAGRSTGSLSALFAAKKAQSERNTRLRRRWASVTVFQPSPINRTEGLHE
jgi:hypothetical protein